MMPMAQAMGIALLKNVLAFVPIIFPFVMGESLACYLFSYFPFLVAGKKQPLHR
jgi:hypothetical protein